MRQAIIIISLCILLINSGCDKSADAPPVVEYPDSAQLLGLNRDHTLEYIIYDSVVTFYPDYWVDIDTSEMTLTITRGADDRVELAINGIARDVLTVDPVGILHTGRIYPQETPPDTQLFIPTPIIMPRHYADGSSWSVVSPQYESKNSLLFLYDGYFTERTFLEKTEIILPTSSYQAYHFKAYLYLNNSSSDTLMIIDEYYAFGIGLVKLLSRAGGSRRLIILQNDS